MNRQGFAPVILFIVLGILVMGGVVWYSEFRAHPPTGVSTSSQSINVLASSSTVDKWKVYTNSEFEFEIEYPEAWNATSSPDLFYVQPEPLDFKKGIPSRVSVKTYKMDGRTLQQIIGNAINLANQCQSTSFAGISAYQCDSLVRYFIFAHNGIAYKVIDVMKDDISASILASFKFTY